MGSRHTIWKRLLKRFHLDLQPVGDKRKKTRSLRCEDLERRVLLSVTASASPGSPVSLTVSSLPVGANSITAFYDGDGNFSASSGTASETILPAGTAIITFGDPGYEEQGEWVTVPDTFAYGGQYRETTDSGACASPRFRLLMFTMSITFSLRVTYVGYIHSGRSWSWYYPCDFVASSGHDSIAIFTWSA